MNRDDMILISVDDHVIEPPDMFVGRLPTKYADDAPRLVHREDGTDVWRFRDTVIPNSALNAIAGRPKDINKITHENAMAWYSFEPFKHIAKQDATVGALRKAADGHDISVRSRSHQIIQPQDKLEQFRIRARAAVSATTTTR